MDPTLDSSISIDPETMGGTPVFRGTRVPVRSLFDWLETERLDDFLENFPSVSREQALDVLHLAEGYVNSYASVPAVHENLAR